MVTADRAELGTSGRVRPVLDHGMAAYALRPDRASGLLYRQGAHLAAWAPVGSASLLWTSEASAHTAGVPFRGGVPLCVPWFGNGSEGARQPIHGWARVRDWELLESSVGSDGSALLRLALSSPRAAAEATRDPGTLESELDLELVVRLGAALTMELAVTSHAPRDDLVEVAMHAYWAVSDVRGVVVVGLDDVPFVDRVTGADVGRPPQRFPALTGQEVNRLYPLPGAVTIHDPGAGRDVRISSPDAAQVVVWNPGADNARRAVDLRDDDWTRFVCVEVANVRDRALRVAPGGTAVTTLRAEVARTAG